MHHSTTTFATLLDLPTELIISIIVLLSLQDIFRFSRVCKRIQVIIRASTSIQYEIELQCAGYVDAERGASPLKTDERLRRLLASEQAWVNLALRPTTPHTIKNAGSIYEYAGGMLATSVMGGTGLHLIRFSSPASGTRFERWSHPELGLHRRLRDFTISPADDLLAIIEERAELSIQSPSTPFKVHIRTLSTNSPHPGAAQSLLLHTPKSNSTLHGFTISVVGNLLGIMFSASEAGPDDIAGSGELVIWDWNTGVILTVLLGPFGYPSTFTFLSPSVVMIPQVREVHGKDGYIQPSLCFYGLQPLGDEGTAEYILLGALNLPRLTTNVESCIIYSRSDPSPNSRTAPPSDGKTIHNGGDHERARRKPFQVDDTKRIFVVSLSLFVRRKSRVLLRERTTTEHVDYTVFAHSNAALDLFGEQTIQTGKPAWEGEAKHFEWSEWSHYARWTTIKLQDKFAVFTYGQRFVDYERGPYSNQPHLWDFNPIVVARPEDSRYSLETAMKESTITGASNGREYANYMDPNLWKPKTPDSKFRMSGSAANRWSLVPVSDSESSVIKDKDVFVFKKVRSSLPYRRVTSRFKLPDISGVMMDDERIVQVKINRRESTLELVEMALDVGKSGDT